MTALTILGVRKAFGTHQVLDGIDLTVRDGELAAVLGASGCGKTTLLRLVAGFTSPDAGTIRLGDDLVADGDQFVPAQRRRVGYVPQEGALFPHLDVQANIVFGLPRAQRKVRHRVDELLELVGLERAIRARAPHELSGGQQQRVALARALAPRPALLLLDEPFSSLDATLRTETRDAVVRALRNAGAAALLVTHDQGEAMSMSDRIAIMRDGRIVQADTPAAVYGQPTDAETARSVGEANVLAAEVCGGLAHTSIGPIPLRRSLRDGPTRVLVRPEQVRIHPADDNGAPCRARVDRVHFYGHDWVVDLTVLATEERVLARITGGISPAVGVVVNLQLAGDALPC
ncbi:MAG: ABC transporter ATP-binding protein [Cellulomonas sp.]